MARTGKIARLPFETREQLNRRLRNGEKGPKLLQWLNGLPETQALMAKEFAAQPINPTNLSQWRTGGFEAWLNDQEALGTVHEVMDQAGQLAQVSHDALSDRLAVLVTARYALAARKLGQEQADWQPLRELCHDLAALRRGDHAAGWLHIEQERLADERKERDQDLNELFLKWARNPEIRDAICRGYISREDRLALLKQQMFGDLDELLKKAHPGHPQPPASPFENVKPAPTNQAADCPACAEAASALPPTRHEPEPSR